MANKDDWGTYYPKVIFQGINATSVGEAYIDHDTGEIRFKRFDWNLFRKFDVVARDSKFRFKYRRTKEFCWTDKYTGDEWVTFFFGLDDGKEFSFNESVPGEIALELQYLKHSLRMTENELQNAYATMKRAGIKTQMDKHIADEVERARKLVNNYGGFAAQQQQNTK